MNLTRKTIISTSVGKNTLKEMEHHHSQQKSLKYSTWMQSQKRQNDLWFPRPTFNITVIQIYALTSNAEEAEDEWIYEDLQDLLELTPPKDCPFYERELEYKSRNSRNTWKWQENLALKYRMKQGKA